MSRFRGRVAVVTGSTQGVGEALLHQMADEGLVAAIVTGRNAARGVAVVEALEQKGCDAHFVPADLANADDVAGIAQAADDRFGRIDHLANCAGITDRGDIWDTEPDLFDRMMAVNVRGSFNFATLVPSGYFSTSKRKRMSFYDAR